MFYAYVIKSVVEIIITKVIVKILRLDYNNIMPDTLKLKGSVAAIKKPGAFQ
jgi:hypothetical protein